jgi:LPS-assembly protein
MNYHASAVVRPLLWLQQAILLPIGLPATMPDRKTPSIPSQRSLLSVAMTGVLMVPAALTLTLWHIPAFAQTPQQITQPADGILRDWRTRDTLEQTQAEQLPAACCGMFVEPVLEGEFTDQNPDEAPTQIQTPDAVRLPEPGQLYVDGEVSVQQGHRTLRAAQGLHLNEETNILTLLGDVVFREPGFLVTGQGARMDQNTGDNQINQASYVMHTTQLHGYASQLGYNSESGLLTLENGQFSRCEPFDPFWVMQARELRLDSEIGVGYATEVTLRIRDVPVFYYPYTLQFPIGDERVSGILPPLLSNSRDGGIDLAVPYYFNLAPHYDATLTPRIITRRGAMLSAEFRYLASWSMNVVNLALLPKDQTFDETRASVPGSSSPPQARRWFTSLEHEGVLAGNWRTFIDYNAVSDADYFRDLGSRNLNLESRTHLNKEGVLSWQNEQWRAETRLQRTEILDPYIASIDVNKPFDRLPELRLQGNFRQDAGLRYGFAGSHVRFDRSLERSLLSQDQLDRGALVTGERFTADPWVSLPLRRPGYFVVPTARYRYANWQLDQQALGTASSPDRGVGVFSVDSGLIFERPAVLGGLNMVQTLEPRLFYLYSAHVEQQHLPTFDTAQLNFSFNQLFREDRFSGADRIGDANQFSAALTSRFITEEGSEQLRLSVGQIFYFRDRQVSLDSPLQNWLLLQPMDTDRSPLVMEASYRPGQTWQVLADLQWDQEKSNIDQGSIALQWHADNNRILNMAYRYREKTDVFLDAPLLLDPRIRQTDISGIWPLNDNWRLLGRWNYDHSNSRNLETFAGVEYSNCCTTMRLIARDWVNDYEFVEQNTRQNRGIFFQISLHGLGNLTGGGLSSLLSNSIPGFKEQDSND